jgi:hypothetical protein
LDKASSVHQGGEFLSHDLARWLDPDLYPPERHEFILDMMQDEDIGLCFLLPNQKDRYLVPEALPRNTPNLDYWPKDVLRFRFVYSYLPPGLIPRFIVQSNKNLTPDKSRWWTGVILNARDCPVLVRAYPDQKRVDIEVDGRPKMRRAALNVILNDLEAVHELNPEAEPVARVPLPDRPDLDVIYKDLLDWERQEGSNYKFYPPGAGAERKYSVGELLDGVRRDESKDSIGRVLQKEGCDGPASVSIIQNFDQRSTVMGDIFANIKDSTIVNRSLVERSFNKVKSEADEETAKVLIRVAEVVADSGNKEAGEILDQFNEELAKPVPRKSLLKRSWDNLVQVLPTVTTVAGAAAAIAKLFG